MRRQLNDNGIKKLYTFLESRVPGLSKNIKMDGDHLVIDGLKMYISVPMEGVTDSPSGAVTGTPAGVPKSQASAPTAVSDTLAPQKEVLTKAGDAQQTQAIPGKQVDTKQITPIGGNTDQADYEKIRNDLAGNTDELAKMVSTNKNLLANINNALRRKV